MSDDNRLLLLSIQQTLDENTETLKQVLNKEVSMYSSNDEEIKLDMESLETMLNTQFSAFNTMARQLIEKRDKPIETLKPTVINKNYSFIGSSGNTLVKWNKLIYFILTLFFLALISWLGLHYWFNEGYKIEEQHSSYKTLQIIKYNQSKTKYSNDEIDAIYNKFLKKDKGLNEVYLNIENERAKVNSGNNK